MKKIVCIFSIIALLVFNYGATVFAETTENPSNPTTAEPSLYNNSTEPTTEGFDVNNLPEILADGNRMYPEVCDGKEVYYCRYSSNANGTIKIWSGGGMETFRMVYDENLNLLIRNNDLEENVLKNEEGRGGLSFEVEAGKTYVIAVGMFETCDDPEKICFWVDFSTSYLPTETTETLTDKPTEPVTTEPTEPTDKATEPAVTESTEPSTDKPTEPVTTEPTEPTDKATEPAVTESTEPSTDKPTEPVTTEPTTPAVVKSTVNKKANTIKVTAIAKTVKAKKLNSKKQSVKLLTVTKAQGKFTVTLVKSETSKKIRKKVTVSKKGVFTLNRGKYTKGTYKIKVKIFAKGNSKYKSKTINKTVTIKIK